MLSWFENYPEDERPPQWMWPFDKALEAHFEQVKAERDNPSDSNGPEVRNEAVR